MNTAYLRTVFHSAVRFRWPPKAGRVAASCLPLVRGGRRLVDGVLLGLLLLSLCVAAPADSRAEEAPVSFELDIQPILSSRGCNSGPCHGKARGQNGFQLSLLGFDSDFDYDALSKNARGRRVFPAAPERSLLLQKATGQLPHGGGVRIEPAGPDYQMLKRWIATGLPRATPQEPQLQRVTVKPTELFLKPNEQAQLEVTAHYSDGSTRNVTALTQYQSNESGVVAVDKNGLMKASPIPGEATIMARYMNVIATCGVAIPLPGEVAPQLYEQLPRANFIDELVWKKLKSLGIVPSAVTDDARFLRRVHLDLIGRLPTPEEVQAFLADQNPNKRTRVVDELLDRPEYADHWAGKWADLLRPNPYRVGIKAVLNYDQWIRDSFRRNKPYDQFVRELVTAQGSTWRNGAATLFRDRREPDELTTIVSQLFLGIRLECAKCHHHPFEIWGQDDFYSFAAFFARVGHKGTGLSPPISGGEEMIITAKTGQVKHPISQKVLEPRPLFTLTSAANGTAPMKGADAVATTGTAAANAASGVAELDDPRLALADWITADANPFFAQVMVNRVWADIMGRGLVEPVDDLRATNPASNPPLLNALADEFRRQKYDIKKLLRTITTSQVYALSSLANERNTADTRNYSRHYRTRLRAEVILDALADITGAGETFAAMPADSRANQIWTTRVGSVFLDTFGRPNPNQDPPCERTPEATVTQTLHLMNAPQLHQKVIAEGGRAALLAAGDKTPDQIIDYLYLLVYGRHPIAEELEVGRKVFAEKDVTRRRATEDLMWALINTPEFMFKD
ncbi:MAG: DUF1549 domain-containing protein [Planctomycetota bacterium]